MGKEIIDPEDLHCLEAYSHLHDDFVDSEQPYPEDEYQNHLQPQIQHLPKPTLPIPLKPP